MLGSGGAGSGGAIVERVDSRLSGRIPLVVGAPTIDALGLLPVDGSADEVVLLEAVVELHGQPRAAGFALSSAGGEVVGASLGGSAASVASVDGERAVELGCRAAAQRPRTPSTALNRFAEPVLSAFVIASRVGASCCSSCNSRMPSCNRRPMSETAVTFVGHGCLQAISI